MTDLARIEYFFLRYVPNAINEEGLNLAVILLPSCDVENGICTMRLAPDWRRRVELFDPDADLNMLGSLLTEIQNRLISNFSEILCQMEDSFSNAIQLSPKRECRITLNPETIDGFVREVLLGQVSLRS
jgi:hypothetical protein